MEWLHSLVSDWQLLADLSFADLILWVPLRAHEDARDSGWVAVAQMRPTTGPTSFPDDVVGTKLARGERPVLDTARVERRHSHSRVCRGVETIGEVLHHEDDDLRGMGPVSAGW